MIRSIRPLRSLLAGCLLVLLLGAAPLPHPHRAATARTTASRLPYLPGSEISLHFDGLEPPYALGVIGAGSSARGTLSIANAASSSVTVVAANRDWLAMHRFDVAAPPDRSESFIAVATYDDGVVLHDVRSPFAPRSLLAIGGAPADVAIDTDGRIAAGDTSGTTLLMALMDPWRVRVVDDVWLADELEFDSSSHALFVTNRDIGGHGALTRILPDGTVTQRILGITSEGIAIDAKRHRVYVANANDGTISIVDADTFAETQRFHAVDRAFSLALAADRTRLYVVSNQSAASPFGAAGRVVSFDVSGESAHLEAQSAPLAFPLGIAVDAEHKSIFVTDERDDDVYDLDPVTLRARHAPLKTCRTPWKPAVDASDHRLYIPCAQADLVDVFDTRTLRRVPGAPFATGGYPLSVAVWHPDGHVVR